VGAKEVYTVTENVIVSNEIVVSHSVVDLSNLTVETLVGVCSTVVNSARVEVPSSFRVGFLELNEWMV
jgi:hypothetical protein